MNGFYLILGGGCTTRLEMMASEVTLLTTGGSSRHERSNKVMDGSRNQNLESHSHSERKMRYERQSFMLNIQTNKQTKNV